MAAPPEYKKASPPMAAGSPGNTGEFPLPGAKRQRISSPQPTPTAAYPQAQVNPSQHVSPYANPSPSQSAAPTPVYSHQSSATASPRYNHSPLPQSPHFSNTTQSPYTTPYSNGSTPAPSSNLTSQPHFAVQNFSQAYSPPNYGTQIPPQNHMNPNQFARSYSQGTPMNQNQVPGNMGPPLKPAEKTAADEDQTDVLTGTGINLREEEAYSQSQFSFSQNPAGSQSTAYSDQNRHTAGPDTAFYGSGAASQSAASTDQKTQEWWENRQAEAAWQEAARKLALSRQEELANPFSQPKFMMYKMDHIAREEGIRINTRNGSMGRLIVPGKDYELTTKVKTTINSTGEAVMSTHGTLLPDDNLVVDQLILLSLAAKHRTRQLVEDVVKIARGRPVGSHGTVPTEWADLAVPASVADGTIVSTDPETSRTGWESAVSPHTNPSMPMKLANPPTNRLPTPISDGTKTPVPTKSFFNEFTKVLRDQAEAERQQEEERLRKRNARKDGTLRNGSIAPGTPGSAASSVGATAIKAPTKKEIEKRTKEKKKEDAASNMSANATSALFLNKKNKGKNKYAWMNQGAQGNGGMSSGTGFRTASGSAGSREVVGLTQPGLTRFGQWREDGQNSKEIQMRDWIAALEQDGCANKELQRAMLWLDGNTKPARRDNSDNNQ